MVPFCLSDGIGFSTIVSNLSSDLAVNSEKMGFLGFLENRGFYPPCDAGLNFLPAPEGKETFLGVLTRKVTFPCIPRGVEVILGVLGGLGVFPPGPPPGLFGSPFYPPLPPPGLSIPGTPPGCLPVPKNRGAFRPSGVTPGGQKRGVFGGSKKGQKRGQKRAKVNRVEKSPHIDPQKQPLAPHLRC